MANTAGYVFKAERTTGKLRKRFAIQKLKSIASGLKRRLKMNNEELAEKYIPISFIREITERDICLVYRGCLLMLLDKWEREKDTYVER
jgi:hypothetical protein